MSIACMVLGHRSPQARVWNDGLFFAECSRCRRSIIRAGDGRDWHDLPSGTKVAWKPTGRHCIEWYDALPSRRKRLRRILTSGRR